MTRKSVLWWVIAAAALLVGAIGYLLATGERGLGLSAQLSSSSHAPRQIEIARLGATETKQLGWDPSRLDKVFDYAAALSSDTLIIATDGKVVGAIGDIARVRPVHSVRKALLSTVIGQHLGAGPREIPLDATLEMLGIDDAPRPLTQVQKQATVRHLLNNISGVNHRAAAEAGLTAEKTRRLGEAENKPGTVWAYNNWDHNVLTTIFEKRTGLSVAEAFQTGVAEPLGLLDFKPDGIAYIEEPDRSKHKAASFKMSGRDLVKVGELYLNQGAVNGANILPKSWIDRITSDVVATDIAGLRAGYSAMWWVPKPESGLPEGSFWGLGFGSQALFVIPAWRTVVVHQADMSEFFSRFQKLVENDGIAPDDAFEQLALSCREPANRQTDFCVEHRFILRGELAELMKLIAQARD